MIIGNRRVCPVLLVDAALRETERYLFVFATAAPTTLPHGNTRGG